jgi:catechol 2,3-dioxygenase-like lactoylglutathione lyase family enzyme
MATLGIEHVNVTVADPDATAALMETVFGWQVRWQGANGSGGRTIHVGSPDHYLALCTGSPETAIAPKGFPLNHIAVEVDDLDATQARVVCAGVTPTAQEDYEPGRRFYFFDANGIEFEVVSYA